MNCLRPASMKQAAPSIRGRYAVTCRATLRQRCQLPAATSTQASPATQPLGVAKAPLPLAALAAMPVSLAAFLLTPALSWAVDEDAISEEAVQAVLAASAQEQSAYDLFVSIIFGIVVVLLSVVSLGVAYLSLKTWLDGRQEKEDQEAAKKGPTKTSSSSDKNQKDLEEETLLSLRKSARTKLDKTKGFGAAVAKTPKEF